MTKWAQWFGQLALWQKCSGGDDLIGWHFVIVKGLPIDKGGDLFFHIWGQLDGERLKYWAAQVVKSLILVHLVKLKPQDDSFVLVYLTNLHHIRLLRKNIGFFYISPWFLWWPWKGPVGPWCEKFTWSWCTWWRPWFPQRRRAWPALQTAGAWLWISRHLSAIPHWMSPSPLVFLVQESGHTNPQTGQQTK